MPKGKEEEEEGAPKFRIVDRRGEDEEPSSRGKDEETRTGETPIIGESDNDAESESPGGEGYGEPEITDEEKEELIKQVEASLKFTNTVIFMLRRLAEQTWIHLGLIPNPVTNLTIKNLDEAHKAIDLYENIAKFTENEFEENVRNEIQRLLTDLKLNYTNQLGG